MKIRTAIISVIVTGSLVGGGLYGAYYAISGRKSPVDVIPVSYVNNEWMNESYFYSYDETMEGTVTSQVSQTVELDSEYSIDEIYVSAGDEVTEGTPLFSYDMTKQEIELEAQEIELQSNELQLRKRQKELEKYQGTSATAALESTSAILTSSSAESEASATGNTADENDNDGAGTDSDVSGSASDGMVSGSGASADDSGDAIVGDSPDNGSSASGADDADAGTSDTGIEIEDVEEVEGTTDDSNSSDEDSSDSNSSEEEAYRCAVSNFETLMTVLQSYIDYCSEIGEFTDEDIALIKESLLGDEEEFTTPGAVSFYRDNLADEPEDETITDSLGETVTAKKYELKSEVTDVLTADEIKTLEECVTLMETYHANLVDMLISEAASETGEALEEAVEEVRAIYEDLSGEAMEQVTELSTLESLEAQVVDSLISEAVQAADALKAAVEAARAAYEDLSDSAKQQVTLLTELEELEGQLPSEEETESETESETQSESETESETQSESETESETQSESGTESETQSESGTESETQSESGTESETQSSSETDASGSQSETEPEDIDMASRVNTFLLMAENVLSETASPTAADYQNVIAFFQMYLGAAQADIAGAEVLMESYGLSDEALSYFAALDTAAVSTQVQVENAYQEVCLAYVNYMVLSLDAQTMTREELTAAQEAYDQLGTAWQLLLDTEEPTIADYLTAYDIILRIQELDAESESFLTDLSALYTDYMALSSVQMSLVWNADALFELLAQYDLLQEETEIESESESEFYWDDDDYYGYDDSDSLTAEELNELIEELENEIKELELEIRQNELDISQAQRVVDGKVVTSTLDGTVVSIGDEDGNSDDEYFVKVTNTTGLYVISAINELALETVNVGDVVSGTTYSGDSFSAVIKEISEYPDTSGDYYYSGNSNSSYYTFYALIDDAEGIEEDYCDLTLSDAYVTSSDSIWIDTYFVRTDSSGSSYVYIEGSDGTLKKQYVTTGRTYYDYYIEVTGGLETSDLITFPYGDDVFEGAKTNLVDSIDEASWYDY